ncbi:hypothetical protein LPJ71_000951, partial [Coemansia sp. S17]
HMLSDDDKFIVIASDGLYDQLSDAEVIGSVSQWYEAHNQKGASTLTTEDDNAATHLIRAALSTDQSGRRSDTYIRRLLAIPPPHSRRFRDDISVTIRFLVLAISGALAFTGYALSKHLGSKPREDSDIADQTPLRPEVMTELVPGLTEHGNASTHQCHVLGGIENHIGYMCAE